MPNPGQELASIDFASMLGGPLMAVVEAQAKAALSSVNFIKSVGFKAGTSEDPEATDTSEPIYVTFKYPKEVAPYQPAVPSAITSLTLTTGGSGYANAPSAPPAVTIAAPPSDGTQATAVATVTGGIVVSLTLTNPGSGYTAAPAVTIAAPPTGGTQATAPNAGFTAMVSAVPAQIQEMKLEVPILTMLPIPFIRIDEVIIDFHAKINSMEYQKVDTNLKFDAALEVKQRWPGGSAKLNMSVSYQRTTTQGSSVDRTFSMDIHIKAVQEEMPAGMEKILSILENAMRAQPVSAPKPALIP